MGNTLGTLTKFITMVSSSNTVHNCIILNKQRKQFKYYLHWADLRDAGLILARLIHVQITEIRVCAFLNLFVVTFLLNILCVVIGGNSLRCVNKHNSSCFKVMK